MSAPCSRSRAARQLIIPVALLGLAALPAQHGWTERSAPGAPQPLRSVTLFYAPDRGRTFLFGAGDNTFGMWDWDGVSWARRTTPTLPGSAAGRGTTYDFVRRRLVALIPQPSGQTIETWELDAVDWHQVHPPLSPTPRGDHSLVFDSARGHTVLFGGLDVNLWAQRPLDDTWVWDGRTWVRRLPSMSPAPRSAAAMADDVGRGRIVLFGGRGSAQIFDDTWQWDGANWVEIQPADHPSPRSYHAMAYDAARGRVMLFGGLGIGYPAALNDTWEWDGSIWVQHSPAHVPPARYGHGLTYDATRSRIVLFGGGYGYLSDLWEWDGTDWAQRTITTPPAGTGAACAYDSARNRVVMHGGRKVGLGVDSNLTWQWDGNDWSLAPGGMNGGNQSFHAMAFDVTRGRAVMFGTATLEWDGFQWTPMTGSQPPARRSHAMAYDAVRQRVVLFGGHRTPNHQDLLNDTWDWDGAAWRALSPPSPPAPRAGHALAFDAQRGVTVMYGGYDGFGETNETWEWDGSRWSRRSSASTPPPSAYHALVYDSDRGRCVAIGGALTSGEQWEWDGSEWTARRSTPAPTSRSAAAAAYDSARRQIVLVGGSLGGAVLADSWTFGRGSTAAFASFGIGCPRARPPSLTPAPGQLPRPGTSFVVQLGNVPTNAPAVIVAGASATRFGAGRLPFDLGLLGLTGCTLYTSVEALLPCTVVGAAGTTTLRIPTDSRLVGRAAFLQAVVVDPAANAPGLILSDGGEVRIGM